MSFHRASVFVGMLVISPIVCYAISFLGLYLSKNWTYVLVLLIVEFMLEGFAYTSNTPSQHSDEFTTSGDLGGDFLLGCIFLVIGGILSFPATAFFQVTGISKLLFSILFTVCVVRIPAALFARKI